MSKTIIQLKRGPFRVREAVVDGHRPLRKVYCRRVDLLVSDDQSCELQFRFYIKDEKLETSKAYELERFIKGIDNFSWISIGNVGIINQLSALLTQNPKWARGRFSVEFYFSSRQIVQCYDVGLFYEDRILVMARR